VQHPADARELPRGEAARDVAENAKGKRVSDRHFHIKQSRGFGLSRRFKRKIDGTVVER